VGYILKRGLPQDYTQAAAWLNKAAEQGKTGAQYFLGKMYEDGLGVPQDYAEAYFWLDLAASGNVENVRPEDLATNRDNAASHLTSALLLQTQERARNWFETHGSKESQQ
jgi:uncharacterized protein